MAHIKLENVTKTYSLGETIVYALTEVTFDIAKGEMTALVGPSGSGKSTLLNLIGALDAPDSGSILVSGTDVVAMSKVERADFRNQQCGFIFQNFNLVPVLTALENVTLPAQLSRSDSRNDIEAIAAELLQKVSLGDQIHQPVNRLSGGQMQRVAIARALMNRPSVILADEPTANLDEATSTSILELLSATAKDQNVAIVIATHDPQVLPYCDKTIKLRDGKTV